MTRTICCARCDGTGILFEYTDFELTPLKSVCEDCQGYGELSLAQLDRLVWEEKQAR